MVSLWSESVICTVSHCGTCWRYLLLQTTASLIMALRSLEPVVLWLLANDLEFHFTGKHIRSISRQFPSSHNLPACQDLGFMPCSLHSPCYRIDLVLFLDQPMRVHEISPCYVRQQQFLFFNRCIPAVHIHGNTLITLKRKMQNWICFSSQHLSLLLLPYLSLKKKKPKNSLTDGPTLHLPVVT